MGNNLKNDVVAGHSLGAVHLKLSVKNNFVEKCLQSFVAVINAKLFEGIDLSEEHTGSIPSHEQSELAHIFVRKKNQIHESFDHESFGLLTHRIFDEKRLHLP